MGQVDLPARVINGNEAKAKLPANLHMFRCIQFNLKSFDEAFIDYLISISDRIEVGEINSWLRALAAFPVDLT